MNSPKDIRYPEKADSIAALQQIVDDCPPWAVRLFRVEFKGDMLDYGHANHRLRKEQQPAAC